MKAATPMEDIRRQDRKIFLRELVRFSRVFLWLGLAVLGYYVLSGLHAWIGLVAVPLIAWVVTAYLDSIPRRFINRRFLLLWESCKDRLDRFEEALKQTKRHKIAEFEEMPKTIHAVAESLYCALRRADTVFQEVTRSEGWLPNQPTPPPARPTDAQAQELYRIADKNIAEYRQHYHAVMGGVQRAEAQAAVFTTTLDTLRLKMLGYRLTGKKLELSSQDFLESLAEAKMQLEAIDKALDELELSPFPKTISIMPPGPGEATTVDEQLRLP
jgi:hypothetical protein